MGPQEIGKQETRKAPMTSRNAATRCLVAAVVYHDAGETVEAGAVLSAEIRRVVALCGDRQLAPSDFVTSVLYPPGRGLAERYGAAPGGLIFAAFLRSFLAAADAREGCPSGSGPADPGGVMARNKQTGVGIIAPRATPLGVAAAPGAGPASLTGWGPRKRRAPGKPTPNAFTPSPLVNLLFQGQVRHLGPGTEGPADARHGDRPALGLPRDAQGHRRQVPG